MLPNFETVQLPADVIEVGRIGEAWGVKGWFKVVSHSATPEALFAAKCWYLLASERGVKKFTDAIALPIKEVKTHSGHVVAQAEAIHDRDLAEALRGTRIFVARGDFPAPKTDEYYWVDLIGLNVVNREGVTLGVVQELLSAGPQTVLVLAYTEVDPETKADKKQERMIPFVSVYIDNVDLAARVITVDWQADY